jgi:fructose-1,6-bisphosphatase/inositol monophosphatase family enzyme
MSTKPQQVALGAARAAGRMHLRRLSRIKVTRKTNAIDLATEADQESEQAVIRTLSGAFPDHAILAEESGANARRSEHRWIIDPLDGTTKLMIHRTEIAPRVCRRISLTTSRRGVLCKCDRRFPCPS